VGLSRPVAQELRAKYAEMLSMRIANAAGDEDAAGARPRMARLAARFPGALREIDDLELAEIRRRVAALDAFASASGEEQDWMEPVALFHRLARGALATKRWLAGRRHVDEALAGAFGAFASLAPFPEEIQAWASDLERVASPPRGRLLDVVFARLAAELGVDEPAARRLVFGRGARRRL
jgi:hypothetical protein